MGSSYEISRNRLRFSLTRASYGVTSATKTEPSGSSRAQAGANNQGGVRINFDLSRAEVANLLSGFLAGTQNVALEVRLTEIGDLPASCRPLLRVAQSAGRAWIVWETEYGPMAAWGEYHPEPSTRLNAYLLFVEWWLMPDVHHSLWCYCDPKRPTEWTVGRARA
jgi:hypothetical protein